MDAEVDIRQLRISELELLEPLWDALRLHHAAIAPSFGPPRAREESWRRRRGQYETWLAEPDAFALVAERSGKPVGYAMVHLREGSHTWPLGERAGELETLAVLPQARGAGVGSALLEVVRERLSGLGVSELSLHMVFGNDDALRFYERHGFTTTAVALRSKVLPAQE